MRSTILKNLKNLVFIQLMIILVASAGLSFYGHFQLAASFALGAALMLANVFALGWSYWRIVLKKPVASTVLIIVIKYALLLSSVYFFARSDWFSPLAAGLGIASFVLAILGAAILSGNEDTEHV